jgi:hypothetical protein
MKSIIILLVSVVLLGGCSSQTDQTAPANKTVKKSVKEVSLNSKRTGPATRGAGSLLENNPKLTPVFPPSRPGEVGITVDQLQPISKLKDPTLTPASPPIKPGERVPTVAEVEAHRHQERPPDPNTTFLSPPTKTGERGPTVAEYYKMRKNLPKVNPDDVEVSPPRKPGEPGMTVSQFRALQQENPWPQTEVPPPPIGNATQSSNSAGKKTK